MAHAADCPHFETRYPWDCACQTADDSLIAAVLELLKAAERALNFIANTEGVTSQSGDVA